MITSIKNIHLIVTSVIVLLMFSCAKKQPATKAEFIEYVNNENNGLVKQNDFKEVEYKAKYDALSSNTNAKNSNTKPYSFNFRIKLKKGKDVYVNNTGTYEEYMKKMDYMTFEAKNDFLLIEGNDTIYPSFYHCVRDYGLTPYVDVVVVFDGNVKKKEQENLQLIYHDQLFNNGIIKYQFKASDLKNIPEIKV